MQLQKRIMSVQYLRACSHSLLYCYRQKVQFAQKDRVTQIHTVPNPSRKRKIDRKKRTFRGSAKAVSQAIQAKR